MKYDTKAENGSFCYRKSGETEWNSINWGGEVMTLGILKQKLADTLPHDLEKLSLAVGKGIDEYKSGDTVVINVSD
eukprot:CAMPEP_0170362232 /NCGR_PEP_ID=MMETSP0117_2-20130122/4227_1 /TAXON_ID=400756 /ORGANISM="Durinskia baltica, Strain CSIRO CS-38" /LENGTH=75 /DNA_ID=CAMNT_0010616645 /DNA_START=41 /DNA_END=268 /DNA_ORIENTATION=+